jgi:PAS domain S-box-containing protein
MKSLQSHLSPTQPLRIQLAVMGIITGIYLILFGIVERQVNYPVAATVAFLPIIVVGLWFGVRAGGFYAIGLCVILGGLGVATQYPFAPLGASLAGSIFLIVCGVGAGWIREQFTSRDQMQRDLQLSEERLRSIVTGAPVILFALDNQGVFTFSEGNALSSLGLKPGEAVGRSVEDLFPEAKDFQEEVRRALNGETFSSVSRGPGVAFETRYSPLRNANGEIIGTIGVSVDVFSRIKAEKAYRILVESSVQGLVILQDSKVVFANAAQAALTGYSVEEILAMTPQQNLELAHPEDRAFVARRLQDRSAGKPLSTRAEIRLIRKDGALRWVEMYSATIEYGGKPATQIVTLDITERKQMEAALVEAEGLRLALVKERDLKELKSRFISMVSHQFRTPLSVINTTSYLLENYHDKFDADKRKDYFGKIRSQIDRLDELIENILTISEKEEKGLPFTPTTVNLEVFCREVVAEMQLTSETTHTLIFTHQGDLSSAIVDEKALRHILTNLLSNAIKYSPDGGDVVFNLTRQVGEAIFEIRDPGIGILSDDQRHLFEPFHRGTNVDGIKGNGLGLKIVKDFVDLHGGTVACVSEPDKGTTFTVRLPIAPLEDGQIQERQNSLTPEDIGGGSSDPYPQ